MLLQPIQCHFWNANDDHEFFFFKLRNNQKSQAKIIAKSGEQSVDVLPL